VADHTYQALLIFVTIMGLGLAFTDVLVDALMVENGRPLGLTGAFQSVQWASIYLASILVGIVGGQFAAHRNLHGAFALAACFPIVSFLIALFAIQEKKTRVDRAAFRATARSIREAVRHRDLWVVAGFILFWTFSPSFGPAFLYYQTDVLKFSQEFIGLLLSLAAVGAIVGAFVYAPLSRRVPLKRLIVASIGVASVGTLAYLFYSSRAAALIIDPLFGCIGMITQLAFLDLAAKSCPTRAEGTFFALLMSVYNLGVKGSQITGGYLYDAFGFTPLIFISAAFTALGFLLVPMVKIDHIEARARAARATVTAA
jgi:predicted MFS family arabinose efflux permease